MKTIVLLHGWSVGISSKKYQPLVDLLSKEYKVVAIDFPGFGTTKPPEKPWGVGDYAMWLKNYLKNKNIEPDILIGHSFGGRVAIKSVALKLINPKKLILIASAGVERKNIKVRILNSLALLIPKSIKMMIKLGSKDYREASGVMRESLKLVVGENLEEEMSQVKTPTLLIWGSEDNTTPVWQGRIINNLIEVCEMKIIEGANHGVPYRNPDKVASLITEWLG